MKKVTLKNIQDIHINAAKEGGILWYNKPISMKPNTTFRYKPKKN